MGSFPTGNHPPFRLILYCTRLNGAIPEIVVHNKTGFVIENFQDADEMIKKIKKINREACRMHVEKNFTDEQMAKSYIEIYTKLINKNKNDS